MHAVRTEDEVVVAARAVVEEGIDDRPVLVQRGDGCPEAHVDSVAQDLVEIAVPDGGARADRRPEGAEFDLEERAAALIEESLPRDLSASIEHRGSEPERRERPNRVARQMDPGARMRPARCTLDDLALDAVTARPKSARVAPPTRGWEVRAQLRPKAPCQA